MDPLDTYQIPVGSLSDKFVSPDVVTLAQANGGLRGKNPRRLGRRRL